MTSSLSTATRLNDVGFSDIVRIRNKIMDLRARGGEVFQFEGGEPFLNTPSVIKDAMVQALHDNKTKYSASSGVEELRAAIAQKVRSKNQLDVAESDVVIMNGGMHCLHAAFQSSINPGDEVLVFSPYWTPIKDLVSQCGGRVVFVSSDAARRDGFAATLEHHSTSRTTAIYFNTPQNPGGLVFSRTETVAVAEFAVAHDLIVIADEAYEDLVYDAEHVSIASLPGMLARTITCFTFSKSFSMTGWRIGYAIALEPWMSGIQKCLLYSTNGVSTPTQWAALAALSLPEEYFAEIRAAYRQRRDLMIAGLNEIGLDCGPPAGAFYAFPDCTRIAKDSWKAAEILLERAKVATVPGIVFGPHGECHLRLSFSTALDVIEAGLDALRKHL